jgi:hypothetical protein
MPRTVLRSVWVVALAITPGAAHAQIVSSRIPTDTISLPAAELNTVVPTLSDAAPQTVIQEVQQPTWLGQAGLRLGDGTTPELSIEIYRYRLGLSENLFLPFFLLGGLPTLGREDLDDTVESLLNEYGGTLNVAIGSPVLRPRLGSLLDFPVSSPFGLHLSARGGLKIVDVQPADPDADASVAGLALGLVSAKLLLPIWNDDPRASVNDRAGSLQGELTATVQWTSDHDYRSIFSETDLLSESLFYVNANVALIITDQLYAAAAFTLHANEDRFDRKSTVTLSYLR